jgi:putative hydrolase of the HAD superfamily
LSQLNPKFIFFDLDDTLLDHKKAEQAGLSDVHQHFEIFNNIPEEHLINTYHHINKGLWEAYGRGEIDRHELHQRRFRETFLELGINDSVHEEAGQVYMNYYRNHWEWIDGAKDCYDRITERYDVGIITNGFAETQWLKVDRFNLKETARHIVISEEVGEMKPHPKVFDHATELTGLERPDILYIGDSFTSDVVGGAKASWQVAWYTQNPIEQGYKLADLVFSDFKELLRSLNIQD